MRLRAVASCGLEHEAVVGVAASKHFSVAVTKQVGRLCAPVGT